MAIEHAPDGVRVNVVAPSATDTGLFMRVTERAPDPEALRRLVAANLPMGRLGTADEVCEAVVYLASDASSYVSGAVLPSTAAWPRGGCDDGATTSQTRPAWPGTAGS